MLNIIIKVHLEKLEDKNSTVYSSSSSKCFHREYVDCPQIEDPNNCPCKTIKFSSDGINQKIGVYCCNLNSETLMSSLECASKYLIIQFQLNKFFNNYILFFNRFFS